MTSARPPKISAGPRLPGGGDSHAGSFAKIQDDGSAFSQDEIYTDFNKLYHKYTIMNKELGEFFKRETKDTLNQLCDDYRSIAILRRIKIVLKTLIKYEERMINVWATRKILNN